MKRKRIILPKTPQLFEGILQRVVAGERVRDICREPGMPTYRTIQNHRAANSDYDERFCMAMGIRRGRKLTAGTIERVVEALKSGLPARRQTVVCARTISDLRREDSAFATRIVGLAVPLRLDTPEKQAASYRRRLFMRRQNYARASADIVHQPFAHREAMTRALRSEEVYALALRSVPRGLDPFMCDDIVSEVVVGLLSGSIRPDQAAVAARKFASAYFGRRDLSMDEDRGGWTLGERIADDSICYRST